MAEPASAAERWSSLAATIFTHVAQDDGLPNASFPQTLGQDGDGFLWVGTQNGLARWDGYAFRIYKPDPAIRGSIPDTVIVTLHTDTRGRLWIGTDSAGIVRYDRGSDAFVPAPLGTGSARGVGVVQIADDANGGLWVATNSGLKHLDADGRPVIERPVKDRAVDRRVRSEPVDAVLSDRSGALWIADATGIMRRRPGTAEFAAIKLPLAGGGAVRTLFEDDAGRVWIGTFNHGVYFVDRGANVAQALHETSGDHGTLPIESISSFAQAGRREVWLATADDGILAVNTATFRTRRIRHDPSLPSSLTAEAVLTLFRDRSGLMWVGTTRSLSHCDPGQLAVTTVFGSANQIGGLSGSNPRSVVTAADGRVWAALGKRGANVLDPAGRRSSVVRASAQGMSPIQADSDVEMLAASPAGDVYMGGYRGLFRADRAATTVSRIAVPQRAMTGGLRALLFHGDTLWFAGADRLWQLDRAGRIHPELGADVEPRLTDNRITTLVPGPGRHLWIGTEGGLDEFDPQTRRIERIFPNAVDPSGLSAGEISAILTDRTGRLWVGTSGGGINILQRDARGRPHFRRLGLAQGLPNDSIDALLDDGRGNVWASTDDGLAVIDERTLAIRPILAAEGLGITGYWLNAGARTGAGELIFGGLGGLTIVRPALVHGWGYRPPIAITDISVAGKSMLASRYNGAGADVSPLAIAPDGNSFTVGFSALDYSAPARNRYAYRLEGFDPRWIEVPPSRRFAQYTNVPPGDYRLRLRGTNRDGVWVEKATALPIRVLPAWHQTVAFHIGEALAALALVVLVVRARTGYLRRRQYELEREVAIRTAELHATQRQLERLAYFDALTGLPNRRMFTETFARLLGSGSGSRIGVILLDLDGFKKINDTLGHDAGDAVLVEASVRLRSAIRESDCLARLGGDEFAVLLPDVVDSADVEAVCGRIIESFAASIAVRDVTIVASTSLGVAFFPSDGQTQEALYKSADLALYDAKRAGRNTWRSYHAQLRA